MYFVAGRTPYLQEVWVLWATNNVYIASRGSRRSLCHVPTTCRHIRNGGSNDISPLLGQHSHLDCDLSSLSLASSGQISRAVALQSIQIIWRLYFHLGKAAYILHQAPCSIWWRCQSRFVYLFPRYLEMQGLMSEFRRSQWAVYHWPRRHTTNIGEYWIGKRTMLVLCYYYHWWVFNRVTCLVWDGRVPANQPVKPLIAIIDKQEHTRRRRPWTRAFSTNALKGYEEIVVKRSSQLVDLVLSQKGAGNLTDFTSYFA